VLQALTRANISDSLCFEALTDRSSPLQKSRLEALEAVNEATAPCRELHDKNGQCLYDKNATVRVKVLAQSCTDLYR
jgi:hypothetical protein